MGRDKTSSDPYEVIHLFSGAIVLMETEAATFHSLPLVPSPLWHTRAALAVGAVRKIPTGTEDSGRVDDKDRDSLDTSPTN